MANLIKASTARKYAKAFDSTQQFMDNVAESIALNANAGYFATEVWLPPYVYDAVTDKLTKAGYQVINKGLEQEAIQSVSGSTTKKVGFFKKLLNKISFDDGLDVPYFELPPPYGMYVLICWGDKFEADIEVIDSV
jgi:hypothetical protein